MGRGSGEVADAQLEEARDICAVVEAMIEAKVGAG